MIAFKCKICGGNLELETHAQLATCASCGSSHSLPKINDQRIRNLYERANDFRRNHEFDKAMGIYETIVAEVNDDPEAYWSLVLCKYGVEYVEDPQTKKRVITTHRTLPQSVFIDGDYKKAVSLATSQTIELYKEEANQIDTIQKGILRISSNEDPYDIFICYKETDQDGRRTIDSVISQQLYEELSQVGYKVFFARITLEDKLGQEYEPYIYSALVSAKIMLVVGTKQDYFESPWVRNEWSRFLGMMKSDRKKTIIPLYRDMDAYNLPVEFRILQAQDLNKIGATQDLIRGIKKLIPLQSKEQANMKVESYTSNPVNSSSISQIGALLKRANIFLEDGDYTKANDFSEQALNLDPENGEAYLIQLLSSYEVKSLMDIFEEDYYDFSEMSMNLLVSTPPHEFETLLNELLEDNIFKKTLRYGKPDLVKKINDTIDQIRDRFFLEYTNKVNSIINTSKATKFQLENYLSSLSTSSLHPRVEKIKNDLHQLLQNFDGMKVVENLNHFKNSGYNEIDRIKDAINQLNGYENFSQAAELKADLLNHLNQLLEEHSQIQNEDKKSKYNKLVANLKTPSIPLLKLSISYGPILKNYLDSESLIDFARKELSKLLSIKKKKTIRNIVMLTIFLVLFSTSGFILYQTLPLNIVRQNGTTYQKVGNTYHLTGYNGDPEFIMPNGVRGLPVTVITENAFSGTSIENITLGYFVEEIKTNAFSNSNLNSLAFNNQLKIIRTGAFSNTLLEEITLPDCLHLIEENILEGVSTLKKLTVPFLGKAIDDPSSIHYLFGREEIDLQELTLTSQKTLVQNSFTDFSIKYLSISDKLETLEFESLSGVLDLSMLKIPFVGQSRDHESNHFIGYPFGSSTSNFQGNKIPITLEKLIIFDDESISPFAFRDIQYLESIYFINNVRTINGYSIVSSSSLKEIHFSINIDYAGPFSLTDLEAIVFLEHEVIPENWSSRWNPDNLEVRYGEEISV